MTRVEPVPSLTRRRVLTLMAGAASLPLATGLGGGEAKYRYHWRGQALGAEVGMVLAHPDRAAAEGAVATALAEIDRLEQIFSLYRPDSELSRLNAAGRLAQPSHDLRVVLSESVRFGEASTGAFDVSVQPLWRLFAGHGRAGTAVSPRERDAARALVDYRRIALDRAGVALTRPGMALTLNGIAQGYISDRVADLLRDRGFDHVLVQLGETVARTPVGAAAPWRVAVSVPGAAAPWGPWSLWNGAMATSSGAATPFDESGLVHHLFDPATGASANRYAAVTVFAPRAVAADALSTALAVAPREGAERLMAAGGARRALLFDGRGAMEEVVVANDERTNRS